VAAKKVGFYDGYNVFLSNGTDQHEIQHQNHAKTSVESQY